MTFSESTASSFTVPMNALATLWAKATVAHFTVYTKLKKSRNRRLKFDFHGKARRRSPK